MEVGNPLFEMIASSCMIDSDTHLDNNYHLTWREKSTLEWILNHPMADDVTKEICKGLFNKDKYLEKYGKVDESLSLKDYADMEI